MQDFEHQLSVALLFKHKELKGSWGKISNWSTFLCTWFLDTPEVAIYKNTCPCHMRKLFSAKLVGPR